MFDKNEPARRIEHLIIACMLVCTVALAASSYRGFLKPPPVPSPQVSYHTGNPPVGIPVMLYWIEDNQTITAASAVCTDYAGILPFSLDNSPVPYIQYTDYGFWSELHSVIVEIYPGVTNRQQALDTGGTNEQ
jgi:hypothetical protein